MKALFKFFVCIIIIAILVALAAILGVAAINTRVLSVGKSLEAGILDPEHTTLSEKAQTRIEKRSPECAIILGAGITDSETPSPMLKDRLDAGIYLYKAGLVPKLLITGDNGTNQHNEIHVMLKYCRENGVKNKDIFCDHAGFSTYDSMYRAKRIFCVRRAIVVTQEYHLFRALYVADGLGMDVLGVASDQDSYFGQSARDIREVLARVKDFFKKRRAPTSTLGGEELPITGSDGTVTHGE